MTVQTHIVPTFGLAELEALFEQLKVSPHPILKLPGLEQVRALLEQESGREKLVQHLRARQERIDLARTDPLNWTFEMPPWKDADELLLTCCILGIFGGNRATKTVYAVLRAIELAELGSAQPPHQTKVLVCAQTEKMSIATVQNLVWFFIKGKYEHLNGKQNAVFAVNYKQKTGFSERVIVLPNYAEIHFPTYNQDPGEYEGWEFGMKAELYKDTAKRLILKGRRVPPNVGGVADEAMPLSWLKMFARRLKWRQAKLLWSFTPVKGITPAIKELVGAAATTVKSRPSELLPRKNLPDCPEGHMPYVRKCTYPGEKAMAIYFHTDMNPFGPMPGRTFYDEIKESCKDKNSEYIERIAYGLARDTAERAIKKFGSWNIVKRTALPPVGTNYFFTDPAGARHWMTCWVRVAPGNPGSLYIYRDWPDAQTFGEWAIATERETNEFTTRGWDGDPGPAQIGSGLGITGYKQTFLECERVKVPAAISKLAGGKPGEKELDAALARENLDPYHVRLIRRAVLRGEELDHVQEEIAERYVDSRAAASEHLAEEGGTCVTEQFSEEQHDHEGKVTGPAMHLTPTSGVKMKDGMTLLNQLLDWNMDQPLMPVINQPHLFVSEDCLQMIWMFENYTGLGGEKGACKDPADLTRYIALEELEYVSDIVARGKAGGGF